MCAGPAALGADSGISQSEAPRICAGLDRTVEAFSGHRLDHTESLCIYLEATYLTVHDRD